MCFCLILVHRLLQLSAFQHWKEPEGLSSPVVFKLCSRKSDLEGERAGTVSRDASDRGGLALKLSQPWGQAFLIRGRRGSWVSGNNAESPLGQQLFPACSSEWRVVAVCEGCPHVFVGGDKVYLEPGRC